MIQDRFLGVDSEGMQLSPRNTHSVGEFPLQDRHKLQRHASAATLNISRSTLSAERQLPRIMAAEDLLPCFRLGLPLLPRTAAFGDLV